MSYQDWLDQLNSKGWINPVELGMTRDELQSQFGRPHDTGRGFKKAEAPMIYVYGDIEFHFGPKKEDGLFLIFRKGARGVVELSILQRESK